MVSIVILLQTTVISCAEVVKISPHSESGDCAICHVAPLEKLRSLFVPASTKREMRGGLNQVCLKCHPLATRSADDFLAVGKGHAVSKKTQINNKNLPLAGDGSINCATTCHSVHITPDKGELYIKRLRLPTNDLCTSCHNM